MQGRVPVYLRFLLPYLLSSLLTIASALAQVPSKASVIAPGLNTPVQEPVTGGTRWALLVGIAAYPKTVGGFEIQPLQAPVKDVNALADLLKDPQRGRFESEHVFTLTDAEATRRNILITFNDIVRRAKPEDMVLFYFSGHGYRGNDSESTYLIPYDLDVRDFAATCINFDDLATKIRRMDAEKVVVILDACHAGGVKPQGARAAGTTGLVERYLQAFQNSQGRALLLSSDESEVSWETEDHGVFTRFLLDGLRGQADANDDGIVTFTEVALFVEKQVPDYTREHFPRIQQPTRRYDLGQVRGDMPLAINSESRTDFLVSQETLQNQRTEAILRASLGGLPTQFKEFSLQTIRAAYDKAIHGQALSEQESLLLTEIDALRSNSIKVEDYAQRARIIAQFQPAVEETIPTLGDLLVNVQPADAQVTVATLDGKIMQSKDLIIQPVGATKVTPRANPLPVGTYRVVAKKEGYQTTTRTIEITTDGPTRVTIILEPIEESEQQPEPTSPEPTKPPVAEPEKAQAGTTTAMRPIGTRSQLPRGFLGLHLGPYTPVEQSIADSYGKPWFMAGIDAGWRVSKSGLYLMLSSSYTKKSGDYSEFGSELGDEAWSDIEKSFGRLGVRYMNHAGSDEHLMFVVDALFSTVVISETVSYFGYEETFDVDGNGLGLGVGIRYKAFELRTLADFIRKDDVWLAGYNLTLGLAWNIQ